MDPAADPDPTRRTAQKYSVGQSTRAATKKPTNYDHDLTFPQYYNSCDCLKHRHAVLKKSKKQNFNQKMSELTRHFVDLEGFQVLNKRRYQKVLVERRLMASFVIVAVLSIVCLFVCVLTTSWIIIDHFHSGNMTRFHIGIWAEYRTDYCNNSKTKITLIKHFPTTPKENRRLENPDLIHYYRTQAVFSVITFALMITSISFALYSFEHHRYMFKRLTAGLFVFER
uniref:Uncharacterized protein n=1 Tax=Romanomermis culicivorax TaxID=13658 RepID=A0A915JDY4_ROMCU